MTLDMTQERHKNGVLSFKINDVDQGIAFDDIDIEKTFCLAVSIDHAEDSIEIID